MVETPRGELWSKLVGSARVRQRLERFARNPMRFPGGDHETAHCNACARLVVERFGGEIQGYWHEDNPVASVGESEGGHDFALMGRFIVDPWLHHYYGESPVLDLSVPAEAAEAMRRYGKSESWSVVPMAAADEKATNSLKRQPARISLRKR
jgi:hypothetical protein